MRHISSFLPPASPYNNARAIIRAKYEKCIRYPYNEARNADFEELTGEPSDRFNSDVGEEPERNQE